MLAQTADDVGEALERLGEAQLEWKLDGGRVQLHRDGDEVRAYSRALRDVTAAVPELVPLALALPARRWIADAEVIALRPDGRPEPFQITMRRFGRKPSASAPDTDSALQGRLTPFLFDLLYLDGADLTDAPQRERFRALRELAGDWLVPHLLTADRAAAASFAEAAFARGHEGVLAKSPLAPYEAGGRGRNWLKLKRAHTLDLVVLAAEWGHGRRRGWLSNLHLGARDPERGGFVLLGKTFKGLTDAMLTWQTERLLALELLRDEYTVHVRPELVVEIAFSDVQESARYPGRLALRFARVKRHRPDKRAAEADSFESVRAIFRAAVGRDPPPHREE
jgi:DNA ligase-1